MMKTKNPPGKGCVGGLSDGTVSVLRSTGGNHFPSSSPLCQAKVTNIVTNVGQNVSQVTKSVTLQRYRQGTFSPTQLKRKPALPIDRRVKPCMRGFRGDPLTIKSDKRTALAEEYQATGTHRGLAHLFIKRSDSQLRTWRPLTVLHIEAVAHPP